MKFLVEGSVALQGSIPISGSKNAAIKMIAASLLTEEELLLSNVPEIKDVDLIKTMAESLGVRVETIAPHRLRLKADNIQTTTVPFTLGLPSRSSVIFLGPLLARFGKAAFPQPGGDLIGQRPIDRHLSALASLGAKISFQENVYRAEAARLKGATIVFKHKTVMGTENTILAATLAEGQTTIVNAAQEPEVDDLVELLIRMGAQIERGENQTITVTGVSRLHGASHEILPDRNETVTFAVAAVTTGGDLTLERTRPALLTAFLAKLEKIGGSFEGGKEALRVWRDKDKQLANINLETAPHPGFMTDWQQPFCVLLTQAEGESLIYETIYANRFEYTKELNRMGAKIVLLTPQEAGLPFRLDDDSYDVAKSGEPKLVAKVSGPTPLVGRRVVIPDLRAGATLAIAALSASGKSEVLGIEHIDRGYEAFDEKLRAVGAKMERVEE